MSLRTTFFMLLAAANAAPPFDGVDAPAVLNELSDQIFVSGRRPYETVAQNAAPNLPDTVWHTEDYAYYVGGKGAYTVEISAGYELLFRCTSTCTITLDGLANANGGVFAVFLNGVEDATLGNCWYASSTPILQVYWQKTVPPGIYLLRTERRGESGALFLDRITLS